MTTTTATIEAPTIQAEVAAILEAPVITFDVVVLAENLLRALATTKPVLTKRKNWHPMADKVLVYTDRGRLALRATDFDTELTTIIGAMIHTEGSFAVEHAALTAALTKGMTAKLAVTATGKSRTLTVECGRAVTHIPVMDGDDFPISELAKPHSKPVSAFTLDPHAFGRALAYTLPCVAADDSRPALTGVSFDATDGTIALAAADGFRLAVAHVTPERVTGGASIIIPAKSLKILAKFLGPKGSNEPVDVRVYANIVHFQLTDIDIMARLIQGTYPVYTGLVPIDENTPTIARVNTKDTLDAVKACAAVACHGSGIIRLNAAGRELTFSATDGETRTVERTVELSEWCGVPGKIAFNFRYLQDALAVAGETCTIRLGSPSQQARIDPCGTDRTGMTGSTTVMPMFVQW